MAVGCVLFTRLHFPRPAVPSVSAHGFLFLFLHPLIASLPTHPAPLTPSALSALRTLCVPKPWNVVFVLAPCVSVLDPIPDTLHTPVGWTTQARWQRDDQGFLLVEEARPGAPRRQGGQEADGHLEGEPVGPSHPSHPLHACMQIRAYARLFCCFMCFFDSGCTRCRSVGVNRLGLR